MADAEAKLRISAENRTKAAFDEIKRSVAQVEAATTGLKNAFTTIGAIGIGGFAIAEVASRIKETFTGVVDLGDQLNKTSQKIGVSVEALSELGYAGRLADVSLETLQGGLKKLSVGVVETSTNTGEAKAAFDALGISVKDSNGTLKTNQQVMSEVADRFAAMEDGATKSAIAVKLFGKNGVELIPLLNQGSAGLRANAEEARKFGLVMSTEAARAAEEFNDNLTRLKASSEGFARSLAEPVIPVLNTFINRLMLAKELGGLFGTLGLLGVDTGSSGQNILKQIDEVGQRLDALRKKREEFVNPQTGQQTAKARMQGLFGGSDLKAIDDDIKKAETQLEFLRKLAAKIKNDTGLDAEDFGALRKPFFAKLVDPNDAKKAEQLLEKFRDKLRSVQDDIARQSGIDSSFLAMKRLLADDKDFSKMSAAQKQQLLDAAEQLDIVKALKEQDKERVDAIAAGAEERAKWTQADYQAADAIRNQIDPLRQRNQELERARELLERGRITAEEFKVFEIDPRVRELIGPVVDDFDRLLEALEKGQITEEQFRLGMERIKDTTKDAKSAGNELGLVFQSAFEDAVLEGKKLSDVLKGLEKDIARVILRKTITEPIGNGISDVIKDVFKGSGGGSSGGGSGFVDFFKNLFGGARAGGGPVSAGTAYLVGERGPELFVPGMSGSIVPNAASGGTYYIDARGADQAGLARLESTIKQLNGSIERRAVTAVADARRRNLLPA